IYDAVNSVLRTHQPYRFQLEAQPGASPEAAAVGAGYAIIKGIYPSFGAPTDDLYASYVARAGPSESLTNGLALGTQGGQMTLDSREGDDSQSEVPYIPSDAPGQWRRTPPFFRPPLDPQWRYVTLFCLPDTESFLPPPPPAL